MMKRWLLATACLLATTAASRADGMAMPMHHGAAMSPAEAANAAAMRSMMSGMDVKPSGDADADFARMMLAHHQGAIAMARVELDHGKDATMRALAAAIIKAQETEIAAMQGWLAHR